MFELPDLVNLLEEGWECVMTNVVTDDEVINSYVKKEDLDDYKRLVRVKLGKGSLRRVVFLVYDLQEVEGFATLNKLTSLSPGSGACIYPVNKSNQSFLRYASICGLGSFNRPSESLSTNVAVNLKFRVIGLDLEQTTLYRNGAFPLPTDPLISAAIVAWDGRKLCRLTGGSYRKEVFEQDSSYDIGYVEDSTELVEWIFTWIELNDPDFICIHFGFKYDIPRMCSHAMPHRAGYFVHRNLGKLGKGMDLNIPGCTVIDTHWYLDKVHRSDFDSLSLDSVAVKLGLPGKHPSPEMAVDLTTDVDLTEMVYYNIVDSYLHMQIAIDSKCITEIIMLAKNSRSLLSDCSRYITGTISACLMSYFAYNRNQLLDWSDDEYKNERIEGAKVFEPISGYHDLVVVLDFAAMYPSVMTSLNLSLETTEVLGRISDFSLKKLQAWGFDSKHCDGAISWDRKYTYTTVNGYVIRIRKHPTSVTHDALVSLVDLRKKLGKNTAAGWTLKVAVNSIYGLYASRMSGLSSFAVGASVTLGGRIAITYTEAIAHMFGYRIVYGDTDSVFLSKIRQSHITPQIFVSILSKLFSFTPLHGMLLEYKETYSGFIIIAKKMYFGRKLEHETNGEVISYLPIQIVNYEEHVKTLSDVGIRKSETFNESMTVDDGETYNVEETVKGLAPQRKDRSLIVRESVLYVCRVIIETKASNEATKILAKYFSVLSTKINLGIVNPLALVRERRKKGEIYYEYIDSNLTLQLVRKTQFDPDTHAPSGKLTFSEIRSNCDKILKSCGISDVARLISLYDSGKIAF
jgi:DNA polymerase elongation subunit (family B)